MHVVFVNLPKADLSHAAQTDVNFTLHPTIAASSGTSITLSLLPSTPLRLVFSKLRKSASITLKPGSSLELDIQGKTYREGAVGDMGRKVADVGVADSGEIVVRITDS